MRRAARPSPFSDFSDRIKRAQASTDGEWLGHIARIGRGEHLETVTTEEFDDAGLVTKRTTRTTASHRPAWQAFAWLLDRRHPERWARTERLPATDQIDRLDPGGGYCADVGACGRPGVHRGSGRNPLEALLVDRADRPMTHELRQIRPRSSCGSAIWVEVIDAVCVDKASRAHVRARPRMASRNSTQSQRIEPTSKRAVEGCAASGLTCSFRTSR